MDSTVAGALIAIGGVLAGAILEFAREHLLNRDARVFELRRVAYQQWLAEVNELLDLMNDPTTSAAQLSTARKNLAFSMLGVQIVATRETFDHVYSMFKALDVSSNTTGLSQGIADSLVETTTCMRKDLGIRKPVWTKS